MKKMNCAVYKTTKHYLSYREIRNMPGAPVLYPSLDSILDVFNKPDNKIIQGVEELLEIFEKAKSEKERNEAAGEIKKYPLIVLEGLDGSGKTTVGNRFARKIDAVKRKTPPESICHIRHLFDNHQELRSAYYSLGNYIAAYEIQLILRSKPVVLDRYWHSSSAYAIAQAVQDYPQKYMLPPKGDMIYKWPDDLFKPDIVLLLNVDEEVRKQRQSRRKNVTTQEDLLNSCLEFRKNVIEAYKSMYNPEVVFIDGNLSFGPVLGQLFSKTKHLLQN